MKIEQKVIQPPPVRSVVMELEMDAFQALWRVMCTVKRTGLPAWALPHYTELWEKMGALEKEIDVIHRFEDYN